MPSFSFPWLVGTGLPIVGAGFWWGPGAALLLSFLSALSIGFLPQAAGSLPMLGALPLSLWIRTKQFHGQVKTSEARQAALRKDRMDLQEEKQRCQKEMHVQEGAIQRISDLYDLSKQFLATLEMERALQITEEALIRWLPDAKEEDRLVVLDQVRSLVEKAEVSSQSLLRSMPPADGSDGGSLDRWGIISGQLALGLQRVCLYRQVQESALHDGLTGLYLRRHFRERLEEEVARTLRRGSSLAFLMVDLDHFKEINDAYGHLVGDVVLREVAQMIRGCVREVDLVGRYGGEEFGVVLPDADRPLGMQIADRIRTVIGENPIQAYDERITTTVSVGVALCPEDAADVEQLLEQSDQAMYRAKAKGRNQTVAVGAER